MKGGGERRRLTVVDVCQQFGGAGLLSTFELFAFAVELKGFNGTNTWAAQDFIDQATNGQGARLKPEFATMPLGELLELVAEDLQTNPEAAAWREPA